MQRIYENLYQFSAYIPPMDFSIHQYLLAADPTIVFATGTRAQAEQNLPQIRAILGERPVKYIFVSHLESDECGGLPVFLRAYPQATALCSALGARELSGYGYAGNVRSCHGGEVLEDGELRLRFFDCPAEMHLQNGLVCFEEKSGVFYSADLMSRRGNGTGKIIAGDWREEVDAVGPERVPNAEKLAALKTELRPVAPKFIAVGHGFCLSL